MESFPIVSLLFEKLYLMLIPMKADDISCTEAKSVRILNFCWKENASIMQKKA